MTTILSARFIKQLKKSSELQLEFASDPWLYFLLENIESFSEKCLEFLHFWFQQFVLSKCQSNN